MITNQLMIDMCVYKNQFEKVLYDMHGSHILERTSLEVDAILFRLKYMCRNNVDLDQIPELRKEFQTKSIEVRKIFSKFMRYVICDKVIADKFNHDDVIDIFAHDVAIDNIYVKFKMAVISDNKDLLDHINLVVGDDIYNIFPTEYFRFFVDSYNDGIAKAYPELFEIKHKDDIGTGKDGDVFCHSFTFQTSENCSLRCTYCYQHNKTSSRMSFDTAKKFIDNLLDDNYGYINRYNSPAIILEFIGGEPLLEIDLTREIYEYFLKRTYELDHPWFALHRLSMCSNGLQYFNDNVQSFFKDYSQNVSFNISIDGNRELHDACRIQPNGEGSYDICMKALNHYNASHSPERNSKMTLAPENITYLFESVKSFIDNGMRTINLNCIFEEGWTQDTALIEYNQLKQLANHILDNDLENLYISIFSERQEDSPDPKQDGNFCGGVGSMLSLRPNGEFYPCIRYMPSSVGDGVQSLCIGDIDNGLHERSDDSDVLELLDSITRRSQSNDICFDCPIGNSCAWCSACGHDVFGTPNKRTTFICIQRIAECLANVYYWNLLNIKHPEYQLGVRKNNVPDNWAKLVIDDDELDYLKSIEISSMISVIEFNGGEIDGL